MSVRSAALERVTRELTELSSDFAAQGLPRAPVKGQLLRPIVAYLALPHDCRTAPGRPFWSGALALQMIHEASLVHDDIVDEAETRRDEPTAVARMGVAPALVWGDHLLTAAYRVALTTEQPEFVDAFVAAVERTVAGELEQGRRRGQRLSLAECASIASKKSGELFGAALALAGAVSGAGPLEKRIRAGRALGAFYQRVDDLLDCCPGASAGKPPFQDYRHGQWTWVFEAAGLDGFDHSERDLRHHLFGGGGAVCDALLRDLTAQAAGLTVVLESVLHDPEPLSELVRSWMSRARAAATAERYELVSRQTLPSRKTAVQSTDAEGRVRARALALGGRSEWQRYFRHHSRTFSLAARLFPRDAAESVEGIYAFCRFTDDLVDGRSEAPGRLEEELDIWATLARDAYQSSSTGIALLDDVLGQARCRGVPFGYAEELIRGVAMDLRPREYENLSDLRTYTHRVASVVGLWLTESFGQHDPWVLSRAAALGHAMQLTNILRDVGEDLEMGRLYLPTDLLARHELDRRHLLNAVAGDHLPGPSYVALLESLMLEADRHYDLAMEAIPALPRFAQRPIAVAARVYQGIHQHIRQNGYDNLHMRAHTRTLGKARLSWTALRDLRAARRHACSRITQAMPRDVA